MHRMAVRPAEHLLVPGRSIWPVWATATWRTPSNCALRLRCTATFAERAPRSYLPHLRSSSLHVTIDPSHKWRHKLLPGDMQQVNHLCNTCKVKKKANNRRGSRLTWQKLWRWDGNDGSLGGSCSNPTGTERWRLESAQRSGRDWPSRGQDGQLGGQRRVTLPWGSSLLFVALVFSPLKWELCNCGYLIYPSTCMAYGSSVLYWCCRRLLNPAWRNTGEICTDTHIHVRARTHTFLWQFFSASLVWKWECSCPVKWYSCAWRWQWPVPVGWTQQPPCCSLPLTSNVPLQVSNPKQWATGAFWGNC